MEQETLEEASIRLVPNRTLKTPFGSPYEITPTRERNTFKKGAKWQAERMYSEEEVYNLLCSIPNFFNITIPQQIKAREEWFEQFKKK
jgi:hypothetical protein